jgi:hypothetical protein
MVDLQQLTAPFLPEAVSWRVGSTTADKKRGMALGYIDARDVMDRLDGVCGIGGWQCRYPHANGKTVCEIGIKFGEEWIWKADGAGDTDFEAEKGALSDAFKRAAVRWGIGRYLYDLDAPWVAIEPAGKSFKIPDSELAKLRERLAGRGKPAIPPKPAASAATRPPIKTTREAFIASTEHVIDSQDNAKELIEWWNSAEEKSRRREAGLSQADVDDLTARLKARRGELERPVNLLPAG